jgi:hypothetical protein
MEFFQEYLEREDPFNQDDAFEEARDEVITANPDLPQDSEEFRQLVSARVDEMEANYYVAQWEEQGRNFDHAREEFDDEQRGNYSEQDWLESQGIRYASDVQNEYNDLTWPYWTSTSAGDAEADIKGVALDFMNSIGMDTVAVSDNYHGSYEKWNGSEWVSIGRNKPDDCFTIEPDGSLTGDNSSDAGLEFVSPPIPLEDIGTVMSKVQNWAGKYGAYTGLDNKTSMHTNISVPGYDLDKLDYVKAALLLGDEHVLRQFERFGNTYAKPAIEKVRQLVRQKPDQAKELLDKMKSQLNAEASKLIHSGTTDKFTSINTKNNRIEYRSPGGDYLSDIADNPKKLIDTINRMVVTMDAAMDPEKYKQEYQKKLYKLLTGQESGREGATGKKKEIKADDKDLLNIFSRYAAGELPKQALKSFVRQVQLQRKITKGDTGGEKYWWSVGRPGYGARAEVVASSKNEAIAKGKQEYPDWASAQDMTATPLRPYIEPSYEKPTGDAELDRIHRELGLQAPATGPTLNGRPSNPDGNYVIVDSADEQTPVYRYMASGGNDSLLVLRQWIAANPGRQWNFKFDPTQLMGQPTAQSQQPAAENQGNWGFWLDGAERFVRIPRTEPGGDGQALRRFETEDAASAWLNNHRARNPGVRADISVREIPADYQWPPADAATTTPAVNRNTLMPTGPGPWEVFRISDGSSVAELGQTNRMSAEVEARRVIDQRREAPELYGVRTVPTNNTDNWSADFERRMQTGTADAAQGGTVDVAGEQPAQAPQTLTRPGQGQQQWTGEWLILDPNDRVIHRFGGVGNVQADANRIAMDWLRRNPRHMQAGVTVAPEMQ